MRNVLSFFAPALALLCAILLLAQPTGQFITVDIPVAFDVRYPALSPSQCYRVARPADGRITAQINGPGNWEVCIGDQLCPVDCFDSGQRTASTEPLTSGTWYYVKVISKSPDATASLSIRPTVAVQPSFNVSGDWVTADSGDTTDAAVTFTQTGSRLIARARFKFRGYDVSWNGEGTLNGDSLRTSVVYDRLAPGWTSSVNGRWEMTVSQDGQTMTGRWINNAGQSGSITYRRATAAPRPVASALNVTGTWVSPDSGDTTNAVVIFTQTGSRLTARATFKFRGYDVSWNGEGTLNGSSLRTSVVYDRLAPGWTSSVNGRWEMTVSPDGQTMTGRWINNAGQSGSITYRRATAAPRPVASALNVTGTWVSPDSGDTTNAVVTFTQTGSRLTARARFKYRGADVSWNGEGSLTGNSLRTTVIYDRLAPGWTSAVNGRWEMTISADGQTMTGRWYNDAGQSGAITYRRSQ
jgi:hypothetical protein